MSSAAPPDDKAAPSHKKALPTRSAKICISASKPGASITSAVKLNATSSTAKPSTSTTATVKPNALGSAAQPGISTAAKKPKAIAPVAKPAAATSSASHSKSISIKKIGLSELVPLPVMPSDPKYGFKKSLLKVSLF